MLLVDTYNVLHVTGVLPAELAGLEPGGLAALIARSRYRSRGARLICDGTRPRGPHESESAYFGDVSVDSTPPMRQVRDSTRKPRRVGGGEPGVSAGGGVGVGGISIEYAGAGREADEVIERALATSSAARRMLVVSSDRRLRRAAGRSGASWIDSADFLAQLVHDVTASGKRGGARPGRPAFAEAVPLDGASVAWWLDRFGTGAEALIRSAGRPGVRTPTARQAPAKPETPPTAKARPILRPPGPKAPPDEGLRKLLEEEWRGAVRPDDLDMTRWLPDLEPDDRS